MKRNKKRSKKEEKGKEISEKKPKNQADTIQELEQKAKHNKTHETQAYGRKPIEAEPGSNCGCVWGHVCLLRGTV